MKDHKTKSSLTQPWRGIVNLLSANIGTKIILPYLLLTVAVAGVGAFVVVRLVTDSRQERFNNQLLDAGRVVSETMVEFEEERLKVLRAVAGTEGVGESLIAGDQAALAAVVPQILINSNTDAVELLNIEGREVYGWQRPPNQTGINGEERTGADYSNLTEVRRVLNGFVDEFGEKRALMSETPFGLMIFTVGPVYLDDELVGAALVGTYISEMATILGETAVARVTLYDSQGNVVETTLGRGQEGVIELLQEPPEQYRTIQTFLGQAPHSPVVIADPETEVPLRRVQVLDQEYTLAYGDWRIRGQSLGLFSVALLSDFIVSEAATSRNVLGLIFFLATIGVFILGYIIARRIILPLQRLAQTSVAVAEGDLDQRTGIRRRDEIGSLAQSFDTMTDRLVERNRKLIEQTSELEAILNSTADGIIVLDPHGVIITANPAAKKILSEVSSDFVADILRELPTISVDPHSGVETKLALDLAKLQQPRRYEVGNYVLSAMIGLVKTPSGEELGIVIALRDITREAEAERLKDGFITNISHELRTPLTAIKGNVDLLLLTANGNLSEQQIRSINTIDRSTNKLLHHINQIIDISQIQANSLRLNKEEIHLTTLVETVVESWRERLESKDLSLKVSLPETDLWVDGDSERLRWAIDNLMRNAYNYTLAGGVEVQLCQKEEEAHLIVTDTGVGIAESDKLYLFTRFFRATPHESLFEVPGVGLGLFITRSIIELHDGRAWAESEYNIGSTFTLALPLLKKNIESK